MVPLINSSAFVGDYFVANRANQMVNAQLNNLIDANQEKYMRELLGPIYYNAFSAWLDAEEPKPVNPAFQGLLDGATFQSLQGIYMYAPPVMRPLTAYCYSAWNSRNATQTVSMGEVQTDSQNASKDTALIKVVDRWNEMVSDNIAIWEFLNKELNGEADWQTWKLQSMYYYTQGIYVKKNRLDL